MKSMGASAQSIQISTGQRHGVIYRERGVSGTVLTSASSTYNKPFAIFLFGFVQPFMLSALGLEGHSKYSVVCGETCPPLLARTQHVAALLCSGALWLGLCAMGKVSAA